MNYIVIIVAAVASMALGFLWYSPMVFGKPWMKLIGMTEAKMNANKGKMPTIMGLSFLFTILAAYVLAWFISMIGTHTWMEGLKVGFWAWLGFVVTTMVNEVLFQDKAWNLYYINVGYQLASFLVMGAILGGWM